MSIQQNINQTLSLASFIISQSPLAERKRESARTELRERHEDERVTRALHEAQALYENVSNIPAEKQEEGDLPALERRTGKYVAATEEYEKRFSGRSPLEGELTADEISGEGYVAEQYLRGAQESITKRKLDEQRAREDLAAAREIEARRQLGPKGISREAVESRLWNREGKE